MSELCALGIVMYTIQPSVHQEPNKITRWLPCHNLKIYIYTHIYIHIHICIHKERHMFTFIYISIYIHIYI